MAASQWTRRTLGIMVPVTLVAVLGVAAPSVAWATFYGACGPCIKVGATYKGARANIEVRSGSIGSADAGAGHYICERVEVFNQGTGGWVDCGYTRGIESSDVLDPFWACKTLGNNYFRHRVVNIDVTVGDTPLFRIGKKSGVDKGWACAIDGVAAQDSSGDNIANNCVGNHHDSYSAGLDGTASSGKLGTAGDPVNATNLKKTTDGTNWSFLDGDGFVLVDSSGDTHGGWSTSGHSLWTYRNY